MRPSQLVKASILGFMEPAHSSFKWGLSIIELANIKICGFPEISTSRCMSSQSVQVEKICQRLTEEWQQPPLLALLLPTAASEEALTALDSLSDRGVLNLSTGDPGFDLDTIPLQC